MKTHGDQGWESFPSYLDVLVPRVLSFLKDCRLTITFFVVGQDAALEKNRDALGQIAAHGHEIGNHSFHHEPWLHLYTEAETESELRNAEEHIERATGQKPEGFRGPGYSFSPTTLRVLERLGYRYDASTLPTYLGPLARAYYFMSTKLNAEERRQRKDLFGKLSEGFRSIKPYRWQLATGTLIELPVTTMPILKVPMHFSYVLYLSGFSSSLALRYFQTGLDLCRLTNTQPSLLLHPLDFLGSDDMKDLNFFPGMNIPSEKKLDALSEMLHLLSNRFTVWTLRQHAQEVARTPNLPLVKPGFEEPECYDAL